ncbi:MAG: hypothetical protein K9N47_08585 [Prosthecobacter sp.]|uniref:hypothetical protein n=1 Tax=Prosthecobacter sp. TaxID=1965333 RepID=UPI0025E97AD1|nr:hypothetical protein [Prosthecobacter sp.]MCF7786166.1 hypothetical protein [Prosthecobacter sp.]
MNPAHSVILLLTAVLFTGCAVLEDKSPPKTEREMEEEARLTHTVPDNIRDPRPEMPPVGPLSMPMR